MKLHASPDRKSEFWRPGGLLVRKLGPVVSAGVPFLVQRASLSHETMSSLSAGSISFLTLFYFLYLVQPSPE